MIQRPSGLLYASMSQVGGVTTLRYSRLLDDATYPISAMGDNNVVWAYGIGNSFGKHAKSKAVVVNFGTGEVSDAPRRPIQLAHAAMMVIGWGILLPVGVAFARLTKTVAPNTQVCSAGGSAHMCCG